MKKVLIALGAFVLFAAPAFAGDLSLFASWWDTKDADDAFGGGVGYNWQLGEVLGFGVRASYYEEMTNGSLADAIDAAIGSPNFFEDGIKVLPLEAILRFNFARDSEVWDPYVGVGVSYFALDTKTGNIDDEVGWNAVVGSTFGDKQGIDFLTEVAYRWVDGQVGDLSAVSSSFQGDNSKIDVKLDGVLVNMGIVWKW